MSTENKAGSKPEKSSEEPPIGLEDAEVLRRMIRTIESDRDRTHHVFIKVLGGNSRVYCVGPADGCVIDQLKALLIPSEGTPAPAPKAD